MEEKDKISFAFLPSIWVNKYYLDVYFIDGTYCGLNCPLSIEDLKKLNESITKFIENDK
jgi:hypothetical protein